MSQSPDALVDFLRGRDVPCPGCGYNLRDLPRGRCPECGTSLVLSVAAPRLPLTSWASLMISVSLAVGLTLPRLFEWIVQGDYPRDPRSRHSELFERAVQAVDFYGAACIFVIPSLLLARHGLTRLGPARRRAVTFAAALATAGTLVVRLIALA